MSILSAEEMSTQGTHHTLPEEALISDVCTGYIPCVCVVCSIYTTVCVSQSSILFGFIGVLLKRINPPGILS